MNVRPFAACVFSGFDKETGQKNGRVSCSQSVGMSPLSSARLPSRHQFSTPGFFPEIFF